MTLTGQASPTGMADASADPDKAEDITVCKDRMYKKTECIQGGRYNCMQRQNVYKAEEITVYKDRMYKKDRIYTRRRR